MTLRIKQNSQFVEGDWWKWSLQLEGDDSEIQDVESVTYFLHESFANPVRESTDRSSQFKLETEGWGTFTIHAKVLGRDGSTRELSHDLELFYPDNTPARE